MENVKYRVAGYLRLSREDGDKEESESIGSQRSIITHKLEELGNEYELVDFYIDDGYTGLNTDRPAFQRMIEDVEKGYVNSIITKDLSRLSRNSFEANYYIEKFFLENNVRYISVLDNVDTYIKSSNNDMIQFKTLINDWYSKDISKKVRSGVWARKEKGLYLGSLAPYGYIKDSKNKNQLIIEPERAKIIKRIFNMYDSGIRMSEIAKILKQDKVFCPGYYDYGGSRSGDDYKWRSEAIKRILQNKVYIGHTEYGKKLNLSYKSKKVKLVPRQEWKIVEDTHEAIIDKELFDKVQEIIKNKFFKPKQKYQYLLRDLVYCGHCGNKMQYKYRSRTTNHNKRLEKPEKWWYYKCRTVYRFPSICDKGHIINEKTLNEIVIHSLNKKLQEIKSEIGINMIKDEYKKSDSKYILLLKSKNKKQKIENDIRILYNKKLDEIISVEEFKEKYSILKEQEKNIENEQQQLEDECKNLISADKLLKIIEDFKTAENFDNNIMKMLINKIEVFEDRTVNIIFNF